MSCDRERKAVQDLKGAIADLESQIDGATGQLLHGLAGRLQQAKLQLPVAQAALKTCESTVSGKVTPNYQLLFVVYAPPGGKASSSVDYGLGSAVGSSTSVSDAFEVGMSITASVGGGTPGVASASISASVDTSLTRTDTASIDVKKSATSDIKVQGPSADGIDHDHDLYYLCLRPALRVTIVDRTALNWGYDAASVPLEVQYVYGGWLKNPAAMPPGVKARLDAAGLAAADYQQILAANPFTGGPAIDPNRFLPTDRTFPYEPPYSASDPVPSMTFVQKNEVTQASSHKSEHKYGVGLTVSAEAKFATVFTASLKVTGSFKWTNSSTLGTSTLSSQSATVTISGPSFGYAGPTDVLVYWDTVFNTFAFAFPTTAAVATGLVKNQAGQPLAGKEVVLSAGGRTFRTFTDSQGGYRFYGQAAGAATTSAGGATILTTIGEPAPDIVAEG